MWHYSRWSGWNWYYYFDNLMILVYVTLLASSVSCYVSYDTDVPVMVAAIQSYIASSSTSLHLQDKPCCQREALIIYNTYVYRTFMSPNTLLLFLTSWTRFDFPATHRRCLSLLGLRRLIASPTVDSLISDAFKSRGWISSNTQQPQFNIKEGKISKT